MKEALNFIAPGIMSLVFICASAHFVAAQNNCDEILKISSDPRPRNVKEDIEAKNRAIAQAKKFLADPACRTPENAEIIEYLQKQVPNLERRVADIVLYNRFNTSVPAKNYDEAFASGKEIVGKYPDTSLDVALILASIGFDNATGSGGTTSKGELVDKYNGDTIYFAKWALDHINNNSAHYGAFGYEYKTKAYPDGKINALGRMNYIIGYLTYERLNDPKTALAYLYKAAQINSATRKDPVIYKLIGDWYLAEFDAPGKGNETLSDAGEKLALWELQKSYLERALDAYSRAYLFAQGSDPKISKTYFYDRLKSMYALRFDAKAAGLDFYIRSTVKKPFPDPLKPVISHTKNQFQL